MGRGECIPDLARTGGAGGACNPHVVGPHRRTVSECAETGAPGVPTIRCRSVRPDALARTTRARHGGGSGTHQSVCHALSFASPVNPSPAFSMTRPEPLPWWARGTATLRGGCTQVRPRRGGIAARAKTDGGQDMSIPVTDWECPPPKAGERPVVISEAAQGLPVAGAGCVRGGGGVMTELDLIIERHPWVALVIMALCCLMVCTADGWW